MKGLKTYAGVMCLFLFASGYVFGQVAEDRMAKDSESVITQISTIPLSPDDELVLTDVSQFYRMALALLEEKIRDLKTDITLSEVDRQSKIQKIEEQAANMLAIYDTQINIGKVAFAFTVQLGIEAPFRFLENFPFLRMGRGTPGMQASGGVTFAQRKNHVTGENEFAIAFSALGGLNYNWERAEDVGERRGGVGVKKMTPVIAINFPVVEDLPTTTLASLQGGYVGGAISMSTFAGSEMRSPTGVTVGGYVSPNLDNTMIPNRAMILFNMAKGGVAAPFAGQGEFLHLALLNGEAEYPLESVIGAVKSLFGGEDTSASTARRQAFQEQIQKGRYLRGDELFESLKKTNDALSEDQK